MLSAAPDLPETPESRATDTAMRLLTAEHEAKCRVYYVQFSDRIKIGTTSNMRSRMQSIPNERILVTEPGSYALEKQRHNEFKHCRVHGEWFRADDEKLQAHIAGLRKTHRWNW